MIPNLPNSFLKPKPAQFLSLVKTKTRAWKYFLKCVRRNKLGCFLPVYLCCDRNLFLLQWVWPSLPHFSLNSLSWNMAQVQATSLKKQIKYWVFGHFVVGLKKNPSSQKCKDSLLFLYPSLSGKAGWKKKKKIIWIFPSVSYNPKSKWGSVVPWERLWPQHLGSLVFCWSWFSH